MTGVGHWNTTRTRPEPRVAMPDTRLSTQLVGHGRERSAGQSAHPRRARTGPTPPAPFLLRRKPRAHAGRDAAQPNVEPSCALTSKRGWHGLSWKLLAVRLRAGDAGCCAGHRSDEYGVGPGLPGPGASDRRSLSRQTAGSVGSWPERSIQRSSILLHRWQTRNRWPSSVDTERYLWRPMRHMRDFTRGTSLVLVARVLPQVRARQGIGYGRHAPLARRLSHVERAKLRRQLERHPPPPLQPSPPM